MAEKIDLKDKKLLYLLLENLPLQMVLQEHFVTELAAEACKVFKDFKGLRGVRRVNLQQDKAPIFLGM